MLHEPGRPVAHEPRNVASPDERDEVAEFFLVHVREPAAMLVFLFRHFDEHFCRGGKLLHQAVGESRIGPCVVVLARDGEGQNFLFGEFCKTPQTANPSLGGFGTRLELFQTDRHCHPTYFVQRQHRFALPCVRLTLKRLPAIKPG